MVTDMGGNHESRRERHTIGKIAVHGGAGDAQHLRDVGGRDALLPELRALAASASSTLRGRPPLRPLAAAAASPARVRSIMVSRSSWAKAAMMVSIALPIGPSVCRPSVRLRNPIPRDVSSSTTASTCWVLRPSRSSFQTVSTSPSRRWSRQASSWGRQAVEPLTPWSVKTRVAPASLKRVELKLRVLVGGADPCIPDDRQRCSLSHNPVEIWVLILQVMRRVFKTRRLSRCAWRRSRAASESSQSHQPIVFETTPKPTCRRR